MKKSENQKNNTRPRGTGRLMLYRRLACLLIILLQAAAVGWFVTSNRPGVWLLSSVLEVLAFFVALSIITGEEPSSQKILWTLILLTVPVIGCALYLLLHYIPANQITCMRFSTVEKEAAPAVKATDRLAPEELGKFGRWVRLARYLDTMGYPAYGKTSGEYFVSGEKLLPRLLEDLRSARYTIYMEYFILAEGQMTDEILAVLREKAAAGVEVLLMYDDIGSLFTLPQDYPLKLSAMNIHARAFNRFRPVLSGIHNNRDHRKITVIDSRIAYTGGINLSDEYINAYEKYGYWKDGAIRLEGAAARSLEILFREMWAVAGGEHFSLSTVREAVSPREDGLYIPYADSPLGKQDVAKEVYLQTINLAHSYLYISTPYFIVDETILEALKVAAGSGVDVRILLPHRYDKKMVHMVTQSYYPALLEAGVRVYEYTPGFMHAKLFLADDQAATVGTVNLDYRSLRLHFENGVFLMGGSSLETIKKDFLRSLSLSHEITLRDCGKNPILRLITKILRIFSPLL